MLLDYRDDNPGTPVDRGGAVFGAEFYVAFSGRNEQAAVASLLWKIASSLRQQFGNLGQ